MRIELQQADEIYDALVTTFTETGQRIANALNHWVEEMRIRVQRLIELLNMDLILVVRTPDRSE